MKVNSSVTQEARLLALSKTGLGAFDTGPDHLAILERNGDDFPERFKLYCA